MKLSGKGIGLLGLSLILIGCQSSVPEMSSPNPQSMQDTNANRRNQPLTPLNLQRPNYTNSYNPGMAGDFERLAEDDPSFGGYILNSNGELDIFLTSKSDSLALENKIGQSIKSVIQRRNSKKVEIQEAKVFDSAKIHQVTYNYKQLSDWRNLLRHEVFSEKDFSGMSVNIRENAVEISTIQEGGWGKMRSIAAKLKIPQKALKLKIRPRAELISLSGTLDDAQSTYVGGLRIFAQGVNGCTLGLNSNLYDNYGGSVYGYITNAHCTTYTGYPDYTEHFQGTFGSANPIGVEHTDPSPFDSSVNTLCGYNVTCRWSDSAFIEYYPGAAQNAPYEIVRTIDRGYQGGSLSIDSYFPTTPVANEYGIYLGDPIEKIGQTTGWTYGTANEVCVDVAVTDSFTRLCQVYSDIEVLPGDSGSPAFNLVDPGNSLALGLVWGGDLDSTRTVSYGGYISDLASIRRDFSDYAQLNLQVHGY